jgi:biopolymer transport protein ExbD
MKIRNREEPVTTQLSMTSMIDIVFLLLIFFILTFKIAEVEGDFSVRMPLAGSDSVSMDPADLPLKLRMRADERGRLTSIALNEIDLGQDFDQLRANIVSLIGTTTPAAAGEGPELEIDTDYNLRYEHVISAITAVSGYKDGNQVVKLIEKIKFAKPRRSP